eukprot:m.487 g.487  ORF g.487 m.487 type:complete len:59 (-) comp227_c0_seq1:177-353(-)
MPTQHPPYFTKPSWSPGHCGLSRSKNGRSDAPTSMVFPAETPHDNICAKQEQKEQEEL